MVISIVMRRDGVRRESGGYLWARREGMGKQICSICSQGFFYVKMIFILNFI
jgi:hypothetical protein